MNGRPLSITQVAAKVPAILEVWYPGQEGGTAMAEAFFGDINPGRQAADQRAARRSGSCRSTTTVRPTSFRDYLFESRAPLFPVRPRPELHDVHAGGPRRSPIPRSDPPGRTTMKREVTNTGTRAGDEVVQMYVHDVVASVTRPCEAVARLPACVAEAGRVNDWSHCRSGPKRCG